jgi:hypothetical protein
MNGDRPTTFNADARKRIANVVRRVERTPPGGRDGGEGSGGRFDASPFLVRKATFGANGSNDSDYTIYALVGGTEVATSITTFPGGIYVRMGAVLPGMSYVAHDVAGRWEIVQTTIMLRGQPTADAAAGVNNSTFTVWSGTPGGTEATLSVTISNVTNGSSCTIKGSQMATIGWIQSDAAGRWQYLMGNT